MMSNDLILCSGEIIPVAVQVINNQAFIKGSIIHIRMLNKDDLIQKLYENLFAEQRGEYTIDDIEGMIIVSTEDLKGILLAAEVERYINTVRYNAKFWKFYFDKIHNSYMSLQEPRPDYNNYYNHCKQNKQIKSAEEIVKPMLREMQTVIDNIPDITNEQQGNSNIEIASIGSSLLFRNSR